jgi:hypothetical protein
MPGQDEFLNLFLGGIVRDSRMFDAAFGDFDPPQQFPANGAPRFAVY